MPVAHAFVKMSEVGLMTKATAKRLTAMQEEVHEANELLQSDAIKNREMIDEEVREEWEEELQQKREDVARFLEEVKLFKKVKSEWEALRKKKESVRAKFDIARADDEGRRAEREEMYLKISSDAKLSNYTSTSHRLSSLNENLKSNHTKRVALTSRHGISDIQREQHWDTLSTTCTLQNLEMVNKINTQHGIELAKNSEFSEHASKEKSLHSAITLLKKQVEVAEENAKRKKTIQNKRRDLLELSVGGIIEKCDSLVKFAKMAKNENENEITGDSEATIPIDTPMQHHFLPSVGYDTNVDETVNITVLQSGISSCLPGVTVSLPFIDKFIGLDTTAILSSTHPAVTLSGDLCQHIISGSASFSSVSVLPHSEFSGFVNLAVTVVAPCKGIMHSVVYFTINVVPPDSDFFIKFGGIPGPEPGWEPLSLSWKGKPVSELYIDGVKKNIPPSGKLFAKGGWSVIQCTKPVSFCCDQSGLIKSRNPWTSIPFSEVKLPLPLGGDQHQIRLSGGGIFYYIDKFDIAGRITEEHIRGNDIINHTTGINNDIAIPLHVRETIQSPEQLYSACISNDAVLVKINHHIHKIDVQGANFISFYQTNKLIIATDKRVAVWDFQNGHTVPLNVYTCENCTVMSVAVRGNEIIIADSAGKLRFWLPPTVTRDIQVQALHQICTLEDLSIVMLSSSGVVSVFRDVENLIQRDVGYHDSASSIKPVSGASFGNLVASSNGISVSLWDVAIGCLVMSVLESHCGFYLLSSGNASYFDIRMRIFLQQVEDDRCYFKTIDVSVDNKKSFPSSNGFNLLSPGRSQLSPDLLALPEHVIDASSSIARCLGFLKANNLHPPTPCTQNSMQSFIIEFITDRKLTNTPYLDWWQLTPPT